MGMAMYIGGLTCLLTTCWYESYLWWVGGVGVVIGFGRTNPYTHSLLDT